MARARASKARGRLRAMRRLACLTLLLGCGLPAAQAAGAPGAVQDFQAALAEADGLRAEAAAAGFEWLHTGELLQQARARWEAGDVKGAWQALGDGRLQAEMSVRQAQHEATAWQHRVIR